MMIKIATHTLFRKCILSPEIVNRRFSNLDELLNYCDTHPKIKNYLKNVQPKLLQYAEKEHSSKKRRHYFLTLSNYLIRMATRPTPYKLLSIISEKQYPSVEKNTFKSLQLKIRCIPHVTSYYKDTSSEIRPNSIIKLSNQLVYYKSYFQAITDAQKIVQIDRTPLLDELIGNTKNWIKVETLFKKIALKFNSIEIEEFLTYLNKLHTYSVIRNINDVATIKTDTSVLVENYTKSFYSSDNSIKLMVDLLIKLADSTLQRKGWNKLKQYLLENYSFELLPLKKIVYDPQFSFWKDDTTKIELGANYKILRDFIDAGIKENKHVINLDSNLVDSLAMPKGSFSGDLIIESGYKSNGEPYQILSEGISSPRIGKIVGRFLDIYTKAGRKENLSMMNYVFNSLDAIPAEVKIFDNNVEAIINNYTVSSFEINVNTKSNGTDEFKLDDLFVGVDERGIFLWSKSMQREVMPTFTNSINPNKVKNDIFSFLATLTHERYETFNPLLPSFVEDRTWFPRVSFKNIIISREKWRFDSTFLKRYKEDFYKEFMGWKLRNNVPNIVGLTVGESPTVYNLNNANHVDLIRKFINKVNPSKIAFVEMPEVSAWKTSKISQECIPFYVVQNDLHSENKLQFIKENYYFRSDLDTLSFKDGWLSLKILFSPNSLAPLEVMNKLGRIMASERISYFFVQYKDNNFNSLRIRFPNLDDKILVKTFYTMASFFDKLKSKGKIFDYYFDNFRPEYGRYGGLTLYPYILDFFIHDSYFAEQFFALDKNDSKYISVLSCLMLIKPLKLTYDELQKLFQIGNNEISKHSLIVKNVTNVSSKYVEVLNSKKSHNLITAENKFISKALATGYSKYQILNIIKSLFHMHINRILGPKIKNEREVYIQVIEYLKIEEMRKKYDHRC